MNFVQSNRIRYLWVFSVLLCAAITLDINALDNATILRAGADKSCLNYKTSGLCFWLACSIDGCKVNTSVQYSHSLPDVVVSSYSESAPWSYERAITDQVRRRLLIGGGGYGLNDQGLRFYESSVIASPALQWYAHAANTALTFCSSVTKALKLHYLSTADFVQWRMLNPLDFLKNNDSNRAVGRDSNYWGAIYPRNGFIIQAHATKAAAVIAQRAADIVSREDQKHIYDWLGKDCGKGCVPPPSIKENSTEGGAWQLIHPQVKSCALFGDDHADTDFADGSESYAWHLWRPYKCCEPRGQYLLHVLSYDES